MGNTLFSWLPCQPWLFQVEDGQFQCFRFVPKPFRGIVQAKAFVGQKLPWKLKI
jgi:hypothetical protein